MPIATRMPLRLPCRDPAALLAALPPGPSPFLLESGAAGPADVQNYSLAGVEPFLTLTVRGRMAFVEEDGCVRVVEGDPFTVLQTLLEKHQVEAPDGLPGFPGGAVGYLSYDLARYVERLPATARDDLFLPDMYFGFYDVILVLEHRSGEASLVVGAPRGRKRQALAKARRWASHLQRMPAPAPLPPRSPAGPVSSSMSYEQYLVAIRQALAYIQAGDIYQVNISQRFSCPYTGDAWDLYRHLRQQTPAPFSAFLDAGGWQVVSGSPERFIQVRGRQIETRPIKGTRPRGSTPEADRAQADELLKSEKDAAELVMIVDLQRNDIGRVCEYGSVRVPDLRRLEATPNVWHTVATVEGRLRPGVTVADILRATFPGGSITGAPKIRSMEIIEELEPVRRGVYTGAVGYIGFDGNLDLNIAIRTAVVKDGLVYFNAGGGIVADSSPEDEYLETLAKGSGIARALGVSLNELAARDRPVQHR